MKQLGIFAKYWAPGQVKTRLGKSIGLDNASQLYRAFLEHSLKRFGDLDLGRVLCFWPADKREKFAKLAGPKWSLQAQSDGNLGNRMHAFFEQAFSGPSDGSAKVILLGSDTPTLPLDRVNQGFEMLDSHDVILGPSTDGGYYMLGMRKKVQPIFEGIPWSTSAVLQATVRRLDQLGIQFELLPDWRDVDEIEDLRELRRSLLTGPNSPGDQALSRKIEQFMPKV